MFRAVASLLFIFLTHYSFGQLQFQGGLSLSFGQPNNRIGFFLQSNLPIENFKIGARLGTHYFFNGLGTAQKRWESRFAIGGAYSWGKRFKTNEYFVLNHREKFASFGYWYIYYLEKKSKQSTGEITLNLGNFELITQNDALGFKGLDQYRTGTLACNIYQGQHRFGLNLQLWTGNPHDSKATTHNPSEESKMRWGYKDLSETAFGKVSHGILAFEYSADLGYYQTASIRVGLDDERIRHAIQNKLFHDWLLAFTEKQGVKNRHVPMLDQNGLPYLDKEKQELRKTRFYFELGANLPNFY